MLKKITGLICLASVTLAVGCGSSTPLDSGVDQDKKASEVTDDEAKQICEAAEKYTNDKITPEMQCLGEGALAAGLAMATGADPEAACNDAVADCVDSADSGVGLDCDEASAEEVADCDATVGEVETCMKDYVDAGAAAFDNYPDCAGMEDFLSKGELPDGDVSVPESCAKLDEACVL